MDHLEADEQALLGLLPADGSPADSTHRGRGPGF
jgi:hypothetical protein